MDKIISLVIILISIFQIRSDKDDQSSSYFSDIAYNKLTNQSSDWSNETESELAVDGKLGTCSQTTVLKDSYWLIDLGDNYIISHFKINIGSHIFSSNFEVHTGIDMDSISNFCSHGMDQNQDFDLYCYHFDNSIRYVKIKNLQSSGVTICDFKAFVCYDQYFGVNCSKTCHCLNGVSCLRSNGHCPNGLCSSGWNGSDCQTECMPGYFGFSCLKSCHCMDDEPCDRFHGNCPAACANDWYDPQCQTGVPELTNPPMLASHQPTVLNLTFDPSGRYYDSSTYLLVYRVEYRLNNELYGFHDWARSDDVIATSTTHMEKASIRDLQINKHYDVRITPFLHKINTKIPAPDGVYPKDLIPESKVIMDKILGNQEIPDSKSDDVGISNISINDAVTNSDILENMDSFQTNLDNEPDNIDLDIPKINLDIEKLGHVDPDASLNDKDLYVEGRSHKTIPTFRTSCASPMAPNVTLIEPFYDRNTRSMFLHLKWIPLTKDQSNCDHIAYYLIHVQKLGSNSWLSYGAKNDASSLNVTLREAAYMATYMVRVASQNNEHMESESERVSITTPAKMADDGIDMGQVDSNSAGIITGLVIVCIALLVTLLVLLFMCRRYMVKNKRSLNGIHHPSELNPILKDTPIPLDEEFLIGSNQGKKQKPRVKRLPIRLEEFEDYIKKRKLNDYEELRNEYSDLPEGNYAASMIAGSKQDNRLRNRFVNIIPYDHSRVVLRTQEDDVVDNPDDVNTGMLDGDYINASYIDGYKEKKRYIAAQGCNKWSIQDVWRMVWQEKSRRIVMLTNLIEKGRAKCEQYWPEMGTDEKMYANIGVTMTMLEQTSDYVVRTFLVRKGKETREVKQLHYTSWPDHGVPSQSSPLIAFRRKVRSFDDSHPGIIIVHCSAGVGRSGTFIALDYLMDQQLNEHVIDVYNLTYDMRQDRTNMIQTPEQYIFVYEALLDYLTYGQTVIPLSSFESYYQHLQEADRDMRLTQQFELLEQLSAKLDLEIITDGSLPENIDKNRSQMILPANSSRPFLMSRVEGTTNYINATYVDSYRSKNAYIITQMPLTNTVIDLWRLVHDHKCAAVIMLNQYNQQDESQAQYWPEENEECECGPFIVESLTADTIVENKSSFTVRKLQLTYNNSQVESSCSSGGQLEVGMVNTGASQSTNCVFHLQLSDWLPEKACPDSDLVIIKLIERLDDIQKNAPGRPVIIHCLNGADQSGLFVASACIWERMKDDLEVDVLDTIKRLRHIRKQLITNLDQYEFCYKIVQTYLRDFATYSNFS